jgi:TP901 family phage tail tape measure protein
MAEREVVIRVSGLDVGATAVVERVNVAFEQYFASMMQGVGSQEAFKASTLELVADLEVLAAAQMTVVGTEEAVGTATTQATEKMVAETAATTEVTAAKERLAAVNSGLAVSQNGLDSSFRMATGSLGTEGLVVIATAVAIGEATKSTIEWQTTLNDLQNNTILTTEQIQELDHTIQDLAVHTGGNLDQMAEGMMHITNLNYQGADAQEIATEAERSAISTHSNQAAVMNVLASVMREYNAEASQAPVFMDLMHNAAAQGNMTLEEFVDGGRRAISTAANLGVALDDVTAAYAALTRHGFDASQAGTQITGMLTHIVNPSQEARAEIEALSKATGIDLVYDFSLAGLQAKGLTGVLNDLSIATQGNEDAIFKLVPALRGGQGALALTGQGAADMNQILRSQQTILSGQYTPTLDAFNRTLDTTANKWDRVGVSVKESGIEFGKLIQGPLNTLADLLMLGENKVSDFQTKYTQMVSKVGSSSAMLEATLDHSAQQVGNTYQRMFGEQMPEDLQKWITAQNSAITDSRRFQDAQKVVDEAILKSRDQTTEGLKNYLQRELEDLQANLNMNTADTSGWSQDQIDIYNKWHDGVVTKIRETADAYQILIAAGAESNQHLSEQAAIEEAIAKHKADVAKAAEDDEVTAKEDAANRTKDILDQMTKDMQDKSMSVLERP